MTNVNPTSAFKACYIMQQEDIRKFADTLADGFSEYDMFKQICGGTYDMDKMRLFWAVSLALLPDNAICIADSESVNSVLIYVRSNSKEPGLLAYIRKGGLKMLFKLGLKVVLRLVRLEVDMQRVAKRYKGSNDGYLVAFATRLDKQGQHYGKPLMMALLNHLDQTGEGCYLETLKATNVELYQHFSFQLKESTPIQLGDLTLFAMLRPGK